MNDDEYRTYQGVGRGATIVDNLCAEFTQSMCDAERHCLCAALSAFVDCAFQEIDAESPDMLPNFQRGILEGIQRGLFHPQCQSCIFSCVEKLIRLAKNNGSFRSQLVTFVLQCMDPDFEELPLGDPIEANYWLWLFSLDDKPGCEWVTKSVYSVFSEEELLRDRKRMREYRSETT